MNQPTERLVYSKSEDVESDVLGIVMERLVKEGFIPVEYEPQYHDKDETALIFIVADNEQVLTSLSDRPQVLHLVIDVKKPRYGASARNLIYMHPDDIQKGGADLEGLAQAITRHYSGDYAANMLGELDFIDRIRQRDETEEARLQSAIEDQRRIEAEHQKAAEEEQRRVEGFLKNDDLGDILKLVKDEGWSLEAGVAYLAALQAERRALKAQLEVKRRLGSEAVGHSSADEDRRSRRWGRLRWQLKRGRSVVDVSYEGETDGLDPHGFGVLQFSDENSGTYKGHFIEGVRTGHGVAEQKKIAWIGEWQEDQPVGDGVFRSRSKRGPRYTQGEIFPEKDSHSSPVMWKFRKSTAEFGQGFLRRMGVDI